MTLNFKDLINSQLNRLDNNGGSDSERKQDRINISKKHPGFLRVLPLGQEEFPFKPYAEAWVDYTTKDGKQSVARVTVDTYDRDDELVSLLFDVIHYNTQYNKKHQDHKGDKIVINHKNTNFPFRINQRVEFVGIPMAKNVQTGSYELKQNPNTVFEFHNYSVSNAAYKTMLEMTQDDKLMVNGQPFQTDLGYITSGETIPVEIKLNSEGKGYDVRPVMVPLPAITLDYLQRGQDGDFLYFDDPEIHNKLTKDTNPTMYEEILNQLKASVAQQKQDDQESQVNPYFSQQSQQPSNPAPAQAPRVAPASQQQPTQSQQQQAQVPNQNVQQPTQPQSASVTPQQAQQAPVQPQQQNVQPSPAPQAQAPGQPKQQPQQPTQQSQQPMQSLEDAVGSLDDDMFADDTSVDISDDDFGDSLPF